MGDGDTVESGLDDDCRPAGFSYFCVYDSGRIFPYEEFKEVCAANAHFCTDFRNPVQLDDERQFYLSVPSECFMVLFTWPFLDEFKREGKEEGKTLDSDSGWYRNFSTWNSTWFVIHDGLYAVWYLDDSCFLFSERKKVVELCGTVCGTCVY